MALIPESARRSVKEYAGFRYVGDDPDWQGRKSPRQDSLNESENGRDQGDASTSHEEPPVIITENGWVHQMGLQLCADVA